jgi:hypothetical protein
VQQLEDENRRLEHMVAEQALDIQALKAVVRRKGVAPNANRAAVGPLERYRGTRTATSAALETQLRPRAPPPSRPP